MYFVYSRLTIHAGSNLHSSDRFLFGFLFLSFLVSCLFLCFVVDYDTQRKEAKGYFWRRPDGDPTDTAVELQGGSSSSRMYGREMA